MDKRQKYKKMLVNLVLGVAGVLLAVLVLPRLIVFFLPLVVGWLIAVMANPLARFLERRLRIVRKHGSMLIIILSIGLVVLGIYLVVSRLGAELVDFVYDFPELYGKVEMQVRSVGDNMAGFYQRLPAGVRTALDSLALQIDSYLGAVAESIGKPTVSAAGRLARNIPSYLLNVIFTILAAYFFIADKENISRFCRAHVPAGIQERYVFVVGSFKRAVGGYFKAQFKIMFIIFFILLAGFWLLGVDYAVLLALVISLLDFLPFLGTGTALIPWGLYQLATGDYRYALGLLVIYVVSQGVHQLIQPKMIGDTVGLNPAATLVCIYIGYKLEGVIGMIIAVPVGVILANLYKIGAFNGIIRSVKEIARDINDFRKY